jgi:3beta-hydroxy-delta5-steroid dehydrogenase/steroid delta-isomerase
LLDSGLKVHSFDLIPSPIDHDDLTSFTGDIRQYQDLQPACEGVSTIFHTAAVISLLGLCRESVRSRVLDINVGGCRQLVKVAKDAGVARLVTTSTHNVSFDRAIVMGDESTPYATRPIDLYTETKALAEKEILAADNGPTGLRTCALRPGGIWGGSEGGVMLQSILKQVAGGQFKALIGDGGAETDNTHVENLVDAQLLAAEKLASEGARVGGEAYYITDGEPMNALEWVRPLIEGLGETFPSKRLPAKVMLVAGFIAELCVYLGISKESPFSRMGIYKVTRTHTFKIDKAERDLGYLPKRKRLEGLEEILPMAKAELERLRAG